MRRILREYKQLQKQLALHPAVLSLAPVGEENGDLHRWEAHFQGPENTPYAGFTFTLRINVPETYPNEPPKCSFPPHHICHPNIKWSTGEVCLDLLKHEAWSPVYNLLQVVEAISTLLAEPGVDSPLDVDLSRLYTTDRAAYDGVVNYRLRTRPQP
ncbi:AFR314Wp [Eremothecium gossypii ATCC 10895]|uniref:AFR314Wp n=1 Tax=Eremothecium gossypii (strain ATCC 10895 / CBS 109.51 / FGSC 9923 / NRRL Y-1056) TaxID=284811 RepID=Q753J8_EREGS|nr:AFR314Wp [Eremothecium gossypii ATCC 10895]AAS53685.1 AFR314Wp [Eremothecium gossypii ATCC 10895]AEY97998.1 FAFR314Wp [Eremothecium gossypii FDAG1]